MCLPLLAEAIRQFRLVDRSLWDTMYLMGQ